MITATLKCILCIVCSICLSTAVLPGEMNQLAAASWRLSLEQAKSLALANSKEYRRTKSKILMQQVKYAEAVKSIQLKQDNMATFRWSPLLSFKFPEQPALADEYEWQYKPLQIQTEITSLHHQLTDIKYQASEKISNLYVTAFTNQEKINFTKKRIMDLKHNITRNQAKVKTGEAALSDLSKMEQSVGKLESDLSLLQRGTETTKTKISELLKMDVATGYTFENPFITGDIKRTVLPDLMAYTLEHDQSYYEVKLDTQLGLVSLELNERMMAAQYGQKMSYIQTYINQAKQGKLLDGDAFKLSYDQFLQAVDQPWQGHKRILFIKIPRVWFKGEIDGVRYVEDEPYALYSAALDYQDLLQEQASARTELEGAVADQFEAIVTSRNAYDALVKTVAELTASLEKSTTLNKMGELSYQELGTLQEEYEEYQLDALDALVAYSELLYGFDRLTCGGITRYLKGESLSGISAAGGDSYVVEEKAEGVSYYIKSQIENQLFVFGIVVPEDFSIAITDYELWVNGTQIGVRTEAGKEIRHLTLAFNNVETAVVRLYDGEQFVGESDINTLVNQGSLAITGGYRIEANKKKQVAATFSYTTDRALGTVELRFKGAIGEPIAYYQLLDNEGNKVFKDQLVPINETFKYLAFMANDVGLLQVEFYDADKNLLYTGSLDGKTLEVSIVE